MTVESQSDECAMSCDGTWQKRGFVIKNRIATVLSLGSKTRAANVIDTQVLTNYCDACSTAKKRTSEKEFAWCDSSDKNVLPPYVIKEITPDF